MHIPLYERERERTHTWHTESFLLLIRFGKQSSESVLNLAIIESANESIQGHGKK